MTRLDAMLLPGEAVLWRHDPELLAGPKWPYLVGAAVPTAMILLLGSVVLWNVAVPPGVLLFAGLLFLMPAMFCAIPVLDGLWSRAVAVTPDRMVWRSGPAGFGAAHAIARRDIAGATVFEGSAVLVLHHRDGRTIRLSGMGEAKALARALRLRARIWRKPGDEPDPADGFWGRFIGSLLSVLPTQWLLDGLIFGDWEIFDLAGNLGGLVVTAMLAGSVFVHVWAHVRAARGMTPEERERRACQLTNPLCRGEEPPRRGRPAFYARPFAAFDRWLVRTAYGGPYACDCKAEFLGP